MTAVLRGSVLLDNNGGFVPDGVRPSGRRCHFSTLPTGTASNCSSPQWRANDIRLRTDQLNPSLAILPGRFRRQARMADDPVPVPDFISHKTDAAFDPPASAASAFSASAAHSKPRSPSPRSAFIATSSRQVRGKRKDPYRSTRTSQFGDQSVAIHHAVTCRQGAGALPFQHRKIDRYPGTRKHPLGF